MSFDSRSFAVPLWWKLPFGNAGRPLALNSGVHGRIQHDQSLVGMRCAKQSDSVYDPWFHPALDLDPTRVADLDIGSVPSPVQSECDRLVLVSHAHSSKHAAEVRFPCGTAQVTKIRADVRDCPALGKYLVGASIGALARAKRAVFELVRLSVDHLSAGLAGHVNSRLAFAGPTGNTYRSAPGRTEVVFPNVRWDSHVRLSANEACNFNLVSLPLSIGLISALGRAINLLAICSVVSDPTRPNGKRLVTMRTSQGHGVRCVPTALALFRANDASAIAYSRFGDLGAISQKCRSAEIASQLNLRSAASIAARVGAVKLLSSALNLFAQGGCAALEWQSARIANEFGKLWGHVSGLSHRLGTVAPGAFAVLPGTFQLYPNMRANRLLTGGAL